MNHKLPKIVQQFNGQAMSMSLYSGQVLVRYMIPTLENSSTKGGIFAEGTADTFENAMKLALNTLKQMLNQLPAKKAPKKHGK